MLDQTFSGSNLRRISEKEKRRGRIRDLRFFKTVNQKTLELKAAIQATKDFRRTHRGKYSEADQAIFNILKETREEKRKERDDTLLNELDGVSAQINNKKFNICFTRENGPRGKYVYVIDNRSPAQFYANKKLESNISSLYKIKPANRDVVMKQLIGLLSDGFNYHIIRTDISSFFESIPHTPLIQKLKDDQLLSQKSIRLITGILYRYEELSGSKGVGLPRGLGISSYLSELYMREFDTSVRALDDVVFYARYVDDIVVIFAPSPGADVRLIRSKIDGLLSDHSLIMSQSPEKTAESPCCDQGQPTSKSGWSFEYLGYKIEFRNGMSASMSKKRLARYKNRIDATFRRYANQRANRQKSAYRLIDKRIRFLTSNTQLSHNKSNAYVGIFFNNMHLTNERDLEALDAVLRARIKTISSQSLRDRLSKYSFVNGYREKTFRRFHRENEFAEIVKAWKYES